MHRIIVLKCGGSMLNNLSDRFFENISTLKEAGIKPVIVHGGGPAIKEMLTVMQINSVFVDGLRKTTNSVMDVVEMVLSGQVTNFLTRKLSSKGISAVGLSGSDNQLLIAKEKDYERYGYVGDIKGVHVSFLKQLVNLGVVPVIAPIALGENGERYNVNADTAAGAVAKALSAEQLIFITDVPGVMKDDQLLESITEIEVENLISSGIIHGGMIPKVRAAVDSLHDDLLEVMIVDGKQSELTSAVKFAGTIIKKSVGVV